jgi:enoyl-CoA hydratase/carnithine racemase
MTARELAVRTGWLHDVVDGDALADAARAVAGELAALAGPTQRKAKQLATDLIGLTQDDGLEHELRTFHEHWRTHDVVAALRRFSRSRASQSSRSDMD